MKLLQCAACSGRLVLQAETRSVACAFCGRAALEAVPETAAPPLVPAFSLQAGIQRDIAAHAFSNWAARNWLAPGCLRDLGHEFRLVYLPLWRFRGRLEMHWAGLRPALSDCGWRPESGSLAAPFEQDVCASGSLSPREVAQLMPADASGMQAWDPARIDAPWEPPQVSEERAWPQAIEDAARHHMAQHMRQESLTQVRSMQYAPPAQGELRMLPVYVGTLRYLGRDWRFVVSAQHGSVAGRAPYSWRRLGALGLAALLLLAWLLS